MATSVPLLSALRRRDFLRTAWPWRSVAYLLTTVPAAGAALVPLGLLALPCLAALARLADLGRDRQFTLADVGRPAALAVVGLALLVVFGPVVSGPLAVLERRRLRLVDPRGAADPPHRPPGRPLGARLRDRYTRPGTWAELAYAGLMVTLAPVLYSAAALAAALAVAAVASPVLVRADPPVAVCFGQVSTVGQALPYAVGGLLALPAVPYLLAVLAGVHAATARALLRGDLGQTGDQRWRADFVEVARSRARLVDAFEDERRRIERDLHDGAQQRLVGLTLQLGLARLDLPADSPAGAAVAEAHQQARGLMAELRELIHGIHPRVLVDRGLPDALRGLADRCPVPVSVHTDLRERLPGPVESAAYFVVAEALTNVARHAGARLVSVVACRHGDALVVEVTDDGCGGADPAAGSGLTGLADRVAASDGRMLLSSPAGGPTRLRAELPCR